MIVYATKRGEFSLRSGVRGDAKRKPIGRVVGFQSEKIADIVFIGVVRPSPTTEIQMRGVRLK
jgi:hypothetical protein